MDIFNLNLTSLIPAEITFLSMAKFIGVLIVSAFVISLIFRVFFGKGSALNRAVSASMGILCIYVMTVVIYTFNPAGLERYLVPLPFVKFSGDYLYIMDFGAADFSVICAEILSMVILALLYNISDGLLPDGKSTVSWFVFRFFTVTFAIVIHYLMTVLTDSFLPDLIVEYAPTILLVCMVTSLLAGILGAVLGLVLTVVNPVLGLLYAFFFSNKFGKQISKAIFSTVLLCVLFGLLGHWGYTVIRISATYLGTYIPFLAVLLLLWYLLGHAL